LTKYKTRPDWHLRVDIDDAPQGTKLLLLTVGGVLVIGTLSGDNKNHYTQWSELPKKCLQTGAD
jgi:hypothetical protein